jgi:asparagine synthase (glutamine-hydrolysing)
MTRLLSGAFDITGRGVGGRLAAAAAGRATVLRRGVLQVAFTGPLPPDRGPLVLFDGFLTNASELAAALGFPDPDATEPLLAAGYRRFGPGLLRRLSGEFSLLIWDSDHAQGLLARDPLGVRCIYLHEAGGRLCFASEIRHLLGALATRPAPDTASVAHWVAVSSRPGPHTLFEGVSRLEPGVTLLLGRDGTRRERYWAPEFAEPVRRSRPQLAAELREALGLAVRSRLAADGTTGVLMSGGLDSASVVASAASSGRPGLSALCGVFPGDPAVDESELIATLRETLGLGGLTASVRPGGLLASVLEHLHASQLPLLGWGDFWTLPLLRAAAAQGTTVVLGGDGGDELFGARAYLMADELRCGHPRRAAGLARRLPGAGVRPPRRQVARVFAQFALVGALPHRLHSAAWRLRAHTTAPAWLLPHAARELVRSDDPHAWKRLDGPRWWAQPAHALTRGVEEAGIFEHQRHRAALAGLQARHPMFDQALLTIALAQPPADTFDPVLSRPLLREATAGLLPDEVRLRPQKAWFDSLIVDCMSGPDAPAIRRLLTGPTAEIRAYADVEVATHALDSLPSSRGVARFRAMHLIWRLMSIECWLRLQESPDGATLPDASELSRADVDLRDVRGIRTAAPQHASITGR